MLLEGLAALQGPEQQPGEWGSWIRGSPSAFGGHTLGRARGTFQETQGLQHTTLAKGAWLVQARGGGGLLCTGHILTDLYVRPSEHAFDLSRALGDSTAREALQSS